MSTAYEEIIFIKTKGGNSMFYVKQKFPNGTELKVPIRQVFTKCYTCGSELEIDMDDMCRGRDEDILETKVLCKDCAAAIQNSFKHRSWNRRGFNA